MRVAGRDQPGDRDRHVRTQHEHAALLVEHPVGGRGGADAGPRECPLVLERRRVDLAEAGGVEHGVHPVGHRPDLAHLVREHVAGAAGYAIDLRGSDALAGTVGRAHAVTGASSSRVIRAPSSRSRSSIRS